MNITGYRTNEDGTETLAWSVKDDGTVVCIHDSVHVCRPCRDADERIANA